MTVSGFRMHRAERQLGQTLESQTQASRSQDRNRRRRGPWLSGVGFIAAFNGELDEHEAQSILSGLKANANSAVAAAAEEAEADLVHFVGHRQRGEDVELVERLPEDRLLLPREVFVPKRHSNLRNSETYWSNGIAVSG